MLWHIELKFWIWLCFNVVQIKFECRHFASIFIRPSSDGTYYGMVMSVSPSVRVSVCPTLRPSGSPFASFQHFSPTCFDALSWNFAYEFVLTVLQIKFECCQFASNFVWIMLFLELRNFSCMLWYIELTFCICLCFDVLQTKVECRQFAWIIAGVMPPLESRILKMQFSALFSNIFWHIALKFVIWLCLMYYRSCLSVVTLCPSIFCTFLLPREGPGGGGGGLGVKSRMCTSVSPAWS